MGFSELIERIDAYAWGPVTIVFLVGTGLYLSIRLRFLQLRYLKHSVECISGKYDDPKEKGDISHFQALSAALSATIGTGNIAGVATAIFLGGPGAVFWMWITALVGMATKFTSCSLALRFRVIHEDGSASGGPMYFLEKGARLKFFAVMFAFFAMISAFGIGNMVQANSVVDGLRSLIPEGWRQIPLSEFVGTNSSFTLLQIPFYKYVIGVVLAVLVGLVIIGGIRRIAQVACRLVPFMCVVYVVGSLTILITHIDHVPQAFATIVKYAFTPYAAGGGFFGFVLAHTIRYGVARGVFSNESGLGSAPMAHAAAKTKEMIREGFVAMLGPFIDTIIVCSMTALVIIITGAYTSGRTSADLSSYAYGLGLPGVGDYIVSLGLVLFAYSTMLSWSYYGDRSAEYLLGSWVVKPYRYLYCIFIIVGAIGQLRMIWSIADIFNALMALPNLIGLIVLAGLVARETRSYLIRNDLIRKAPASPIS